MTGTSFMKQRGFSLIELTIVLAIFLVITGVTVNIFISIVQHQKRILSEQELLNQTSFAISYMARAIKMASLTPAVGCDTQGKIYLLTHCDNGPAQACSGIKFVNQLDNNTCDEFYFDVAKSAFYEGKSSGGPQTLLNLVSPKFTVKYARFIINSDKTLRAASLNDTVQPKVTILLDVLTGLPGNQQEKITQTTVSLINFIK